MSSKPAVMFAKQNVSHAESAMYLLPPPRFFRSMAWFTWFRHTRKFSQFTLMARAMPMSKNMSVTR